MNIFFAIFSLQNGREFIDDEFMYNSQEKLKIFTHHFQYGEASHRLVIDAIFLSKFHKIWIFFNLLRWCPRENNFIVIPENVVDVFRSHILIGKENI